MATTCHKSVTSRGKLLLMKIKLKIYDKRPFYSSELGQSSSCVLRLAEGWGCVPEQTCLG